MQQAMIEQSFIFLPGVQQKTEQRLWEEGIRTWDDMLQATSVSGASSERLSFWKGRLRIAKSLLAKDPAALARLLGPRNTWRLYDHVLLEPRFLDIETTEYRSDITVVGISDGEFYTALVKDRNLHAQALRKSLEGATCIITFNGASFDLPILERAFPGAIPSVPHFDLRHICTQAGLHGGLKRIEQHLGISRPICIRDMDGTDAIMLWYRYRFGDEKALQELIDYNAADVLHLAPLAQQVIDQLWKQLRHNEQLSFAPLPRPSLQRQE